VLFAGLEGDLEHTVTQAVAVEAGNGHGCLLIIGHGNEAKTLALVGGKVADDLDVGDSTKGPKELPEDALVCLGRQVVDEDAPASARGPQAHPGQSWHRLDGQRGEPGQQRQRAGLGSGHPNAGFPPQDTWVPSCQGPQPVHGVGGCRDGLGKPGGREEPLPLHAVGHVQQIVKPRGKKRPLGGAWGVPVSLWDGGVPVTRGVPPPVPPGTSGSPEALGRVVQGAVAAGAGAEAEQGSP